MGITVWLADWYNDKNEKSIQAIFVMQQTFSKEYLPVLADTLLFVLVICDGNIRRWSSLKLSSDTFSKNITRYKITGIPAISRYPCKKLYALIFLHLYNAPNSKNATSISIKILLSLSEPYLQILPPTSTSTSPTTKPSPHGFPIPCPSVSMSTWHSHHFGTVKSYAQISLQTPAE